MPTYVICTSIEIAATTERVWDVLKDFDRYPVWNPCLLSVTGDRMVGSLLTVSINPAYFISKRFKAKLLEYSRENGIRWIGQVLDPRHVQWDTFVHDIADLFRGDVHATGRIQRAARNPFERYPRKRTKKGYEEMNRALKARSEKES